MNSTAVTKKISGAVEKVPPRIRLLVLLGVILLFIAAAIIISMLTFARAEDISDEAKILELAVSERDSIAETLKGSDGNMQTAAQLLRNHQAADVTENSLTLYYDEEFLPSVKSDYRYRAEVTKEDQTGIHVYTIEFIDSGKTSGTDDADTTGAGSKNEKSFCSLKFSTPDTGTQ